MCDVWKYIWSKLSFYEVFCKRYKFRNIDIIMFWLNLFVWCTYKALRISKYTTKGRFSGNKIGKCIFSQLTFTSKNEKSLFFNFKSKSDVRMLMIQINNQQNQKITKMSSTYQTFAKILQDILISIFCSKWYVPSIGHNVNWMAIPSV